MNAEIIGISNTLDVNEYVSSEKAFKDNCSHVFKKYTLHQDGTSEKIIVLKILDMNNPEIESETLFFSNIEARIISFKIKNNDSKIECLVWYKSTGRSRKFSINIESYRGITAIKKLFEKLLDFNKHHSFEEYDKIVNVKMQIRNTINSIDNKSDNNLDLLNKNLKVLLDLLNSY